MDKPAAAKEMIAYALPLVPFEGWTLPTLQKAAAAAGYKKTDVIRVFPGGAIEAIEMFHSASDDEMAHVLQGYSLDTMKVRERINTAVRIRISIHEQHTEALRRALAVQSLPFFTHRALRSLYRTVDAIWHAVGDTSTDFNFYTKRLMLAGVYASTRTFWLNDASPGHRLTWEFLDRRIEDVMKIEKAKHTFKRWINS